MPSNRLASILTTAAVSLVSAAAAVAMMWWLQGRPARTQMVAAPAPPAQATPPIATPPLPLASARAAPDEARAALAPGRRDEARLSPQAVANEYADANAAAEAGRVDEAVRIVRAVEDRATSVLTRAEARFQRAQLCLVAQDTECAREALAAMQSDGSTPERLLRAAQTLEDDIDGGMFGRGFPPPPPPGMPGAVAGIRAELRGPGGRLDPARVEALSATVVPSPEEITRPIVTTAPGAPTAD